MRIMGLSLLNPEFPSPAGRFLLFTTKVMNRTFPSKIYLIFFLDTANLEFYLSYPCSKNSEKFGFAFFFLENLRDSRKSSTFAGEWS